MKLVKIVSTRQTEDDDPVQTSLTLDFDGLTNQDILEIAAQAAVIKWQGIARRAKGGVPATATYKVPKPGTRSQVDPITALIAKHGGDIKKAIAELQSLMAPQVETEE